MTSLGTIAPTNEFTPVRVAAIPAAPDFELNLYLQNATAHDFRLYRGDTAELKSTDLKRLLDAGITTVYLDAADYSRFQEHLRSSLDSIVADERMPVSQRLGVVNEVVRSVLRDAFHGGNVERTVKETTELADHVVELVCRDDEIVSELNTVLHFDFSTFTHSANVAYYTLILTHALGHSDRAALRAIGIGALLHDLGKVGIPERVLLKPGRLTPEERNLLRSHPTLGLLSLRDQHPLEFGQLMMVYQHHERIDGTGYPVGLDGNDIHEWSRICAIADVFEALTSDRPYRRALSASAAFNVIDQGERKGLDPEFFRCWKLTLKTN
jgi:HD-GYP domain-containing protein (c-di-GMP phosphodiesterase class II)